MATAPLSFVREIPVASSKGEEVIDQMKWIDQIEGATQGMTDTFGVRKECGGPLATP